MVSATLISLFVTKSIKKRNLVFKNLTCFSCFLTCFQIPNFGIPMLRHLNIGLDLWIWQMNFRHLHRECFYCRIPQLKDPNVMPPKYNSSRYILKYSLKNVCSSLNKKKGRKRKKERKKERKEGKRTRKPKWEAEPGTIFLQLLLDSQIE